MVKRVPDAEQTPLGPAFEGRLLERADEEVVDQGAHFDLGTVISRRGILTLVGLGGVAVTLAACAPSGATGTTTAAGTTGTTATGEIPDETAGPFPGDGSNGPDALEQSGIVRSDIRSSLGGGATAAGVAMTLKLTILDSANGNVPFEGVAVYVWHCDSLGQYSMYSEAIVDETYLRGVQVADANGVVTFTSIIPGCYSGRWPHIHFEVYPDTAAITDSASAIATSQVALPEAACAAVYATADYSGSAENLSRVTLAGDNVFGDDGGALQLGTVTGNVTSGYTVALTARVDTRTQPSGGSVPSGGMPPGVGGPTGGPEN